MFNYYLFLCLISLILCQTFTDPAVNKKHEDSGKLCLEYWPYVEEEGEEPYYRFKDSDNDENSPKGVSDCVDNQLWDPYDVRYYDRCCFIRFQLKGEKYSACFELTEEQYMDIVESMNGIEEGKKSFWNAPAGVKVYELNCSSNYIKLISFASILLALIL